LKKLIYIKPSNSTFILRDEEILKRHYDVYSICLDRSTNSRYFLTAVSLFFFLIKHSFSTRIYFTRFADYHTVIPAFFKKLFNVHFFVVVGGYDATFIKKYNYGVFNNKIRAWCARFTYRNATCILPISQALVENTNNFAFEREFKAGIKYFVKDLKTPVKVIPNGFKPAEEYGITSHEKENFALTVAIVKTRQTFFIKGIDSFIETARLLPSFRFIIVGVSKELIRELQIEIPKNLTIIGALSYEKLKEYFEKAKVYCVFSVSEGMSNALCESMLHKCIPVVSNVMVLPEIVNGAGFVVSKKNPVEMAEKIRKAFETDSSLGELAKNQILSNFSMEKREKQLVELIDSFIE
jgi:glycosyltransferase involved in cell wall biosynthesis